MQFSPDGKFLATAGWDKTSVIFRVGVSASYNPAIRNFLIHFFSHRLPPTEYWHMLKALWAKLHGLDSIITVKARLIYNLGHHQGEFF